MAWNEPDNDDRKKDPWGARPGGNKDQGPPDLDKIANDLLRKLGGAFGGGPKRGGTGQGGSSGSSGGGGGFGGFGGGSFGGGGAGGDW